MIKNIIITVLLSTMIFGGYMANALFNKLNTAELALSALQTTISALRVKHKKDILKTKVKERGKRVVVAIPIAGLVALGWFEKEEYDEWKKDNPDGTFTQYADEVLASIKEVAHEVIDSHCSEYSIACDGLKNEINSLTQYGLQQF